MSHRQQVAERQAATQLGHFFSIACFCGCHGRIFYCYRYHRFDIVQAQTREHPSLARFVYGYAPTCSLNQICNRRRQQGIRLRHILKPKAHLRRNKLSRALPKLPKSVVRLVGPMFPAEKYQTCNIQDMPLGGQPGSNLTSVKTMMRVLKGFVQPSVGFESPSLALFLSFQ